MDDINFEKNLEKFIDGVEMILEKSMQKYENLKDDPRYTTVTTERGSKYVRLFVAGAVYAFIDKKSGSIYKAATYRSPAKHARGNIFEPDNGLHCATPYGIQYLR